MTAIDETILGAPAKAVIQFFARLCVPDIKDRRKQYDEIRRNISYTFQHESGLIFNFAVPNRKDELSRISGQLKDLADQLSSSITTVPQAISLLVFFQSKAKIEKASSLLRGIANMNLLPEKFQLFWLRSIDSNARQIQSLLGVSLGMT
jgi:hypothetical protein